MNAVPTTAVAGPDFVTASFGFATLLETLHGPQVGGVPPPPVGTTLFATVVPALLFTLAV